MALSSSSLLLRQPGWMANMLCLVKCWREWSAINVLLCHVYCVYWTNGFVSVDCYQED